MDPAFVALGLLVGLLVGMTGVGAGSLVTPALVLTGIPPAVAIGTDLAYAAVSKTAGTLAHRSQRSVDLGIAGLLALGSVPAAGLTIAVLALSHIATRSAVVTLALAVALVLTALALLTGRARIRSLANRYEARIAARRGALTIVAGALLGVLVTVSSIGAGALGAVLLVALYPDMPSVRIAGTDIAHAVPLTLVAGLGHAAAGVVDWSLLASLLVGSLPGIWLGSRLGRALPERFLRGALAAMLVLIGGKLVF